MKTTFYFLALMVVILSPTLLSAQTCAAASNIFEFHYNGKKYEIIKEMKSWDSAAACAVKRGGYLAQINTEAEQDSIYTAITAGAGILSSYTTVMDGGGIAYLWIGGTDKNIEGIWLWDGNNDNTGINFWNGKGSAGGGGGSAVGGAYNNWGGSAAGGAKEPDNYMGTQNAAGIALANWPYGIAGEWNDINTSNLLYYIVEYDSAATVNSINTTQKEYAVTLYPNPAHGKLSVALAGFQTKFQAVTIYDLAGRPILYSTNTDLNIESIPSGMYMVTVELADGSKVFKPLVIK